jgi:1,4-dihydroxy-2-naphthoyl-CoA synthase
MDVIRTDTLNTMKKIKRTYDFNGGWTSGEASRQVGMKNTQQTHRSKKEYSRKSKHKSSLWS